MKSHTLIPHLKGEILFPTTSSWLIARISLLVRMPKMSGVMADNFERGQFPATSLHN